MTWLLSRTAVAAVAAVNVAIAYANAVLGAQRHWVNLALVPISVVSAIFVVLTCVKPADDP